MEGVAHGNAHGPETLLVKACDCLFHGLARAANDGLAGGIDIGCHDVAIDLLDGLPDNIQRRHDRSHPAVVIHADLGHLRTPGGRSLQGVGEGHDVGGNERTVFTQRMAHDHIGDKTVRAQQFVDGRVHGQHGRLGDGRLHEIHLGLLQRGRITIVHKDIARQRAAENGRHDCISLVKDLFDDGLNLGQFAPHVDVLAALAREEEADLAGRLAAAPEDALGLKRLPGLGIVEACGLARLGDLFQQFIVIAEIDDQPLRLAQLTGVGRRHIGRPAVFDAAEELIQPIFQGRRR